MMPSTLYGFVQSGSVKDGPRSLPDSWRTTEFEILSFNRIEDPTPYGWWPWIEDSQPSFDPSEQRLESQVSIDQEEKKIKRSYYVVSLTDQEKETSKNYADAPTNSDWRVGLIMMGRFSEVESKIIAARDSGSVQGLIIWQRWEYANNVYRSELMDLREVFGFTEEEVDESLARAAEVSNSNRNSA